MPVPLRVGAPGKPLLRVSAAWNLVCELALRVCDNCKGTCNGQCLVCHLVLTLFQTRRVGQVTGQPLWGPSSIKVFCLALRYGGGSLGGEAVGLSVPRSLITTLQRVGAAHGPRHPVYSSQSCAGFSWVSICFCKLFAL